MRFGIITDVEKLKTTPQALARGITHIIIHHSWTTMGDAESFYNGHTLPKPAGRGWRDIGYHYVVNNGTYHPAGTIQLGRDRDDDEDVMEEVGAHVLGYNRHSLGICAVGNFDDEEPDPGSRQIQSIALLTIKLMRLFEIPIHHVLGHREAGAIPGVPVVGKTCPGAKVDCNQMREWFDYVDKHRYDVFVDRYRDLIQRLRVEEPELNYLNGG